MKIKLIDRDYSGEYHINNFGLQVLQILEEFEFISIYQDYFLSHEMSSIPVEFMKRVGEIKGCKYVDNVMNFLSHIDNFFNQSTGSLSLIFNQFPLNSINIVKENLEKGTIFRVIGPKEGIIRPASHFGTSIENFTQDFLLYPLVEYKKLDPFNILLFVSPKKAVISFPTLKGDFDYKGFVCEDPKSIIWFQSLFDWYWNSIE
jgi:predicted transcriptional regulator